MEKKISVTKKITKVKKKRIKAFISYSWDSEPHKKWVKCLADKLIKKGIDVILDQYDLHTGMDMNHFMEKSLKISKKVLLILTPNYKIKAEKRKGGVGHEYSIINSEVSKVINQKIKYIPILKKGNNKTSIPSYLQSIVKIDMIKNNNFKKQFDLLLSDIYDKHPIKPPFGDIPSKFINKKLKNKKNGR
jgi:hypothetical protein